jgi:hypothetical protein
MPTQFERDGFAFVEDVISPAQRDALVHALERRATATAGSRNLLEEPLCRELAAQLRSDPRLIPYMPSSARAVQCTYFEKSVETNWLVAYHQDLAVPVHARWESPEWSGWSEKEGAMFAIAPRALLQSLVAVRVHLDANSQENGPLRLIPHSHRFGRLSAADAMKLRETSQEVVCVAPARSGLVLRPLILHASSKARSSSPRRVLHFLFGALDIPGDVKWHRTA